MVMKDKVVVITGGSRGLGECIARLLISKGAKVVISDIDVSQLQKTSVELGATAIVADVTKEPDMQSLAQQTVAQFGQIDLWINNAGIWLPRAPAEEIDMKRAHELFEVNLFGTMYGSRAALAQMKKQSSGTILNIISTSALQGRPNSSVYCASKYAIRGFTDSLRLELADKGISVTAVYPGGMKTHLFDESKPDDFDEYMSPDLAADKIVENLEKTVPDPELVLKRPGQL